MSETVEDRLLRERYDEAAPFELLPDEHDKFAAPEERSALCLSGGGYKAAAFHLGSLKSLNNAGKLSKLDRITSVSAGSIVCAFLGLKWEELKKSESNGRFESFEKVFVLPLVRTLQVSVSISASIHAAFGSRYWINPYRRMLDKKLYRGATLQDFPDNPRFVINATNMGTGFIWRFMKPRMRDWALGDFEEPTVRLSRAVMASSAFPPFLSPQILNLKTDRFHPNLDEYKGFPPDKMKISLSDAGILDNMGIETSWKKYRTIYVSDGSDQIIPWNRPQTDWYTQIRRAFGITNHAFISMRRRQIFESYRIGRKIGTENHRAHILGRQGAYWGLSKKALSVMNAEDRDTALENKYVKYPVLLSAISSEDIQDFVSLGELLCSYSIKNSPFI